MQTRDEVLRLRLSISERLALDSLAQAERRRPSEMLRELIRSTAKDYGLWPPEEGKSEEVRT